MAGDTGPTQYRIREKALSIGGDFWIETSGGERAFKVDGKAFSDRGTSVLETPAGEELYTIQEKEPGSRGTMEIGRGGHHVATVRKALIGIHHHYSLEIEGGGALSAKGDFFNSEFALEREGDTVAHVSDRWFQVRHTMGVEIAPGED